MRISVETLNDVKAAFKSTISIVEVAPDDKSLVLRFDYWKQVDISILENALNGEPSEWGNRYIVTEQIFEDEDGDDERGNPIMRYLFSYKITE